MNSNTSIPRLGLDGMEADLATYLQPRVKRLGYLGELFQCAGHAPGVLLQFMHFTESLKEALPEKLAETAVLTVASLMQNSYERNQHERLCIRRGFSADWITEVERLAPAQATLMTPSEQAAQRYAIAAVDSRGHACQAEFEALVEIVGAAEAMAIVMLIGRYMTHALIVNTLALKAPVPSIFEDGFAAPGAK